MSCVPHPYDASARYYDRIYAFKAYDEEAQAVRRLLAGLHPTAQTLLEVGCGTAGHLAFFAQWFEAEGLDRSPSMLAVAREKLPEAPLHKGDMRTFELARRFDVVTCLFSSIGYVRSLEELNRAVANMARHLTPGGLLIVEPWFTPDQWRPGHVGGSIVVNDDTLKIARFCVSETRGRFAVTPMHHLVADPTGVTHFVETHELFLATSEELEQAFVGAGLRDVRFDADVLPRGAWIGRANAVTPDHLERG
jgi:SAM-dependent methyltransferase